MASATNNNTQTPAQTTHELPAQQSGKLPKGQKVAVTTNMASNTQVTNVVNAKLQETTANQSQSNQITIVYGFMNDSQAREVLKGQVPNVQLTKHEGKERKMAVYEKTIDASNRTFVSPIDTNFKQ